MTNYNIIIIILVLSVLLLSLKRKDGSKIKNEIHEKKNNHQIVKKDLKNQINSLNSGSHIQENLQKWITKEKAKKLANDYWKLHKLYYDGIPDEYDFNGNKIKGICPDPHKALNNLRKAIQQQPREISFWFRLAEIYHYGMYNLDPQLKKAYQIYQKMFPRVDQSRRFTLSDRLEEIENELANQKVYEWLNIPRQNQTRNEHHQWVLRNFFNNNRQQTTRPPRHERLNQNQVFRDNDQNNQQIEINPDDYQVNQLLLGDTENNPRADYNDLHNTHNSQVVSTVANSIKKLQEETQVNKDSPQTLQEIRKYLKNQGNSDRVKDALKSLNSIEVNCLPVKPAEVKLSDALNLIWNRIEQNHQDKEDDLRETLFHQLADMQEHDKTVCSSGMLARIVDTLNQVDDQVAIKPTYAIRSEMMDKASKIQQEKLDEITDSDHREKLEKGQANDQEDFEQKVKDKIRNDLYQDYVEKEIMTENQFNKEVDEWIEHI